jgi:hypothetical protein
MICAFYKLYMRKHLPYFGLQKLPDMLDGIEIGDRTNVQASQNT